LGGFNAIFRELFSFERDESSENEVEMQSTLVDKDGFESEHGKKCRQPSSCLIRNLGLCAVDSKNL